MGLHVQFLHSKQYWTPCCIAWLGLTNALVTWTTVSAIGSSKLLFLHLTLRHEMEYKHIQVCTASVWAQTRHLTSQVPASWGHDSYHNFLLTTIWHAQAMLYAFTAMRLNQTCFLVHFVHIKLFHNRFPTSCWSPDKSVLGPPKSLSYQLYLTF